MTISTTSNNITYAIDGSTTAFAFTFTVYQSADVKCYLVDSSGTETSYTDFTVVLNDNNAGGTVTTNTTLTTDDGASILIIRETEQTQELDLIEGGKFPSDSVEDSFDKLTMLAQDRQTELSNALKKATSNSQTIGVSVLTDDKVVGYDGENIVSGPVDLDQVDSISARNTAISNAVAGLSGDVTVLKAVATANNTTLDDVAYLATGATLAGEHYFYYVADEITYVSDTALTGSLTDIGTDSNGIRTLTVGGSSYTVINSQAVIGGDTVKYSLLGTPTESQIETVMAIYPNFVFDSDVTFSTGNIQMPEKSHALIDGCTVGSSSTTIGDGILFLNNHTKVKCINGGMFSIADKLYAIRTPESVLTDIELIDIEMSDDGGLCTISGWATDDDYDNYTLDDLITNVRIINPRCSSDIGDSTYAKISLRYFDGVSVIGGKVSGYFGLQYWGGDSSPSVDGAVGNTRFARNLLVKGVNFNGCDESPAWGGMGYNITFKDLVGYRDSIGGDVGFDHEGSLYVNNVNCKSGNWTNAAGAAYNYNGDITYTNCTFENPANYPTYKNWNSSNTSVNAGRRIFKGCLFKCTDTSGTNYATFQDGGGPAYVWDIDSSNVFYNTRIFLTAENNYTTINLFPVMRFTYDATEDTYIIRINGGDRANINVGGQIWDGGISLTTGTYHLYAASSAESYSSITKIHGFTSNSNGLIACDEAGTVSSINGTFWVYDCQCSEIRRILTGSTSLSVNANVTVEHDNYENDGTAISSADYPA